MTMDEVEFTQIAWERQDDYFKSLMNNSSKYHSR